MILAELIVIAALGATWTVDDSGPADFSSIQTAILSVSPGDTLLIMPGEYDSFVLDRRLTLLGPAKPNRPRVKATTLANPQLGFTMKGMEFQDLRIVDVQGRAVVDDCTAGVWKESVRLEALQILRCDEILVSETSTKGRSPEDYDFELAGAGCHVEQSNVTFTDCSLAGGKGWTDLYATYSAGGDGGAGLRIAPGSQVVVSGCPLVVGGPAGWGNCGLTPCKYDGTSGHGIDVKGSTVLVRGAAPGHEVSIGSYDTSYGGEPGDAVHAVGSIVSLSGIALDGVVVATSSTFVRPFPLEPYLDVQGQGAPGTTSRINLYGPPSFPALVVASLQPAMLSVHRFGGTLWLDPSPPLILHATSTAGMYQPASLKIAIPSAPAPVGTVLFAQALLPSFPSTLDHGLAFLSNPVCLVVRF